MQHDKAAFSFSKTRRPWTNHNSSLQFQRQGGLQRGNRGLRLAGDSPGRSLQCRCWPRPWCSSRWSLSTHHCALSAKQATESQSPIYLLHLLLFLLLWYQTERERERERTYMTEGLHLVQHAVHLRHHVHTVHDDRRVGAVPQSHVEHRPTLRKRERGRGRERERKKVQTYVVLQLSSILLIEYSIENCIDLLSNRKNMQFVRFIVAPPAAEISHPSGLARPRYHRY